MRRACWLCWGYGFAATIVCGLYGYCSGSLSFGAGWLRQPSVGRAVVPEPLAVALRWQRILARLAVDSPRYTRLAIVVTAAMLPLLGAFALDARLFQGINVWIKPLKFHLALVIYLITLALFARFTSIGIKRRRWGQWHERAVVLAVVLDLVWIGTAAVLATSSHFNPTPLGEALYSLMGIAAVVLTTASTSLAWAIYRYPVGDLASAMRSGLVWGLALTLPPPSSSHCQDILLFRTEKSRSEALLHALFAAAKKFNHFCNLIVAGSEIPSVNDTAIFFQYQCGVTYETL